MQSFIGTKPVYVICAMLCLTILFLFRRGDTIERITGQTMGWRELIHHQLFWSKTGMVRDVLYIVIPVVIVWILVHKVVIFGVCESASMEPGIMVGDITITNGIWYALKEPQRGDVIPFRGSQTNGQVFVKRIIGMPGEHIEFVNGNVYINGHLCEEEYIDEDVETNCNKMFDVPSDAYFVMGDNRDNSADSRYWDDPYVSRDQIIGRVVAVWNKSIKWNMLRFVCSIRMAR